MNRAARSRFSPSLSLRITAINCERLFCELSAIKIKTAFRISGWTAGVQSPARDAPTRRGAQGIASSSRTQSSKRLDTHQRSGYALLVRRLDQGPARDDDPSARRGDMDDLGSARRPRGRHRAAVDVSDRGGPHAVLTGDDGCPAGGRVGGRAGLWTRPAPPPPTAGGTAPLHGRHRPDSGQSRPDVYRGESLSGIGAIQHSACGWGRVRSTHGVASTARTRMVVSIPGMRHR
jgi:hypothetical protein